MFEGLKNGDDEAEYSSTILAIIWAACAEWWIRQKLFVVVPLSGAICPKC